MSLHLESMTDCYALFRRQTVADLRRRLIGRRFDDETVKKDIESWPFAVIDDNGVPKIQVEYLGEKKSFSAQEISAMVLLKVCPRARVRVPRTARFCGLSRTFFNNHSR